ncbi:MAG: SGNH/GDSL hydrolase family protein [archaeon]
MGELFVFGASTECGAWDEEGGWVERLRRFLYKKAIKTSLDNGWIVNNLAVDGDDSSGMLKRIESEIKPRLWPDSDQIILIVVGANDSLYNNKTKKLRVPLEKFKENMLQIFEIAKKYSDKVAYIAHMPCDESKVDPVPWLLECSYKNENSGKIFSLAEQAAREKNIEFINLFSKFKSSYKNLLIDGVHPNSQGHEQVFNIVKDFLIKKKWI